MQNLSPERLQHFFAMCERSLIEVVLFLIFVLGLFTVIRLLIKHDFHIGAQGGRVIKKTYVVFVANSPTAKRDNHRNHEVANLQIDIEQ
jgi:hypothetical protein